MNSEDRWYRAVVSYTGQACPGDTSNSGFYEYVVVPSFTDVLFENVCAGQDISLSVGSVQGVIDWVELDSAGNSISLTDQLSYTTSTEEIGDNYYKKYELRVSACGIDTVQEIDVLVGAMPQLNLTENDDCDNRTSEFELSSNVELNHVVWEISGTGQDEWSDAADHDYSHVHEGYTVAYYRVTANNSSHEECMATSDVIKAELNCPLFIPNAISPNDDNANDVWKVDGLQQYPEATVIVTNRYGTVIFESFGDYEPWDGTYNGEVVPNGTYFYVITTKIGNADEYTGTLTVQR